MECKWREGEGEGEGEGREREREREREIQAKAENIVVKRMYSRKKVGRHFEGG